MAVRVALGETQLVQEVRRFLLDNGVCLDSFSQVGALGDADLNIRGRGQGLEGWVCQRRSLLTLQLSVKVRKIIGRLLACPFGLYSLWNSLGQNTGVGFPSPGDLTIPGIEPRSPALQADSLPAEPQGKPKNTGVGSLSLLQGIFLAQESNQGLLHRKVDSLPTELSGGPLHRLGGSPKHPSSCLSPAPLAPY